MANISVGSISTGGGNTTLTGVSVGNAQVVVSNGGNEIKSVMASNTGHWTISFPSANNGTVTVTGGGRAMIITVDTTSGEVTYRETIPVTNTDQ